MNPRIPRLQTWEYVNVCGSSDQDESSDWTEDWYIYSDGRIRRDDKVYNDFDEFERDWA